jgi:two-component system, OmpR family, phosphate regulon sensor histidine kinase PhoR
VFRKHFAALLALIVAALAVAGVALVRTASARALEDIELRLRGHVEVLRFLAGRDPAGLPAAARRLGETLDTRFTVIEPERVSIDSHADPATMEDHSGRPEVIEARASGRGSHRRYSETLRRDMVYYAEPLDAARKDGPVLRAAVPAARLEEESAGIIRGMWTALGALAAAGAVISYLLTRRIARPLKEIGVVAEAIAGGDLSRRAPSMTRDEIGALGRAMNRMAEELSLKIEKLRTARARLEATLSTMEDGVLSLDPDGTVRLANGAATALFGLSSDPTGVKLWEAVRLPGLEDVARKVLREGAPHLSAIEVGDRFLSLRITPVRAGEGAVVVAHDVTEDRRYDELRKEFVANASHELRTPLTLIQGYVETLLESAGALDGQPREFLGIIDRNVRRLALVVGDLLDLSRLESGRDVLSREKVELGELLGRVKEAFDPLAARKRQTLSVSGGGEATVDPVLLERALSNLVDNALKYTPERGTIRVSGERADGHLLLKVADDGIGIPPADQARIFERFYRVDRSRSREMGGTGLGLSIVKHVAQLHGGDVAVESAPGKGSVFTLRLPA